MKFYGVAFRDIIGHQGYNLKTKNAFKSGEWIMADDEQPLIDLYRCVCLVTDTMLPLPLVEFLI